MNIRNTIITTANVVALVGAVAFPVAFMFLVSAGGPETMVAYGALAMFILCGTRLIDLWRRARGSRK